MKLNAFKFRTGKHYSTLPSQKSTFPTRKIADCWSMVVIESAYGADSVVILLAPDTTREVLPKPAGAVMRVIFRVVFDSICQVARMLN